MTNRILGLASSLAILALGAVASAQVPYFTSFEPPDYTAGVGVNGIDGWANGSGTGVSQTVSTDVAFTGVQSLKWDNSGDNNGFYSVLRAFGNDYSVNPTLILSARVRVTRNTLANRLYGIYMTNSATGTLGSTNLGLTLGGDGRVRAGNTWGATYLNTGLIGTFTTPYLDRWLEITLTFTTGTRAASASITNGTETFTWSGTAGGTGDMLNFNIGSDFITADPRTGVGYFDDIRVVPEPATLLALAAGLGGLALRRRK